jgi:hypothetical protein
VLASTTMTMNDLGSNDTTTDPKIGASPQSADDSKVGPPIQAAAVRHNADTDETKDERSTNGSMTRFEQWQIALGGLNLLALVLTLVVLVLYTIYTHDSTLAAQRSADIANKQLEQSSRPWISVKRAVVPPIVFDEKGGSITIEFMMKNIGHSPAMYTVLNTDVVLSEVPVRQTALCGWGHSTWENQEQISHTFGVTILPDDQLVRRITYRLDAEAIKRASETGHGFITPTLVGCADYQFEFAPGHHKTAFVDEVFRADKDHLDSEFADAIWPGATEQLSSHRLIMPVSTIKDVVLEPAPIEPSYAN